MKPFVVLLLLLSLMIIVIAVQSFQSRFFETTYSPAFSLPLTASPKTEGGGSPRKTTPLPTGTATSGSTGFKGPTEPPHIIGPTTPPPGQ